MLSRMMPSHLHQCFPAINPTVTGSNRCECLCNEASPRSLSKAASGLVIDLIAMVNGLPATPAPPCWVGSRCLGEGPAPSSKKVQRAASCLPNL